MPANERIVQKVTAVFQVHVEYVVVPVLTHTSRLWIAVLVIEDHCQMQMETNDL